MFNITATLSGEEIPISWYPSEEPKYSDFEQLYHSQKIALLDFNAAKQKWLSSQCTANLKKEYRGEFARILFGALLYDKTATELLKSPVPIPNEVKHRLELVEDKRCRNSCDWPKCTFKDCMEKHFEEWTKPKSFHFILKPEVDSLHGPETEGELWIILIRDIKNFDLNKNGFEARDFLSNKFTITRKTNG